MQLWCMDLVSCAWFRVGAKCAKICCVVMDFQREYILQQKTPQIEDFHDGLWLRSPYDSSQEKENLRCQEHRESERPDTLKTHSWPAILYLHKDTRIQTYAHVVSSPTGDRSYNMRGRRLGLPPLTSLCKLNAHLWPTQSYRHPASRNGGHLFLIEAIRMRVCEAGFTDRAESCRDMLYGSRFGQCGDTCTNQMQQSSNACVDCLFAPALLRSQRGEGGVDGGDWSSCSKVCHRSGKYCCDDSEFVGPGSFNKVWEKRLQRGYHTWW